MFTCHSVVIETVNTKKEDHGINNKSHLDASPLFTYET